MDGADNDGVPKDEMALMDEEENRRTTQRMFRRDSMG
jgi:hypothetical protein